MTYISTRRTAAAIAATICMAIPATAQADYMSRTDAAQLAGARSAGDDGKTNSSIQPQTGSSIQPQTGGKRKSTFPAANFRGGDSPVDHPGASRAQPTPTTIEVVRPERTIVRDVDQALPIALAGTALLLVLATLGITLVRTRPVPQPGRSS
jgi:hypothetical protein